MQLAISAYKSAWDNHWTPSVSALASIYINTQQYNLAARLLSQALSEYPSDLARSDWWLKLGECLSKSKQWGASIQIYKQAVSEFPKDPLLLIGLGWAYYEHGDGYESATTVFNKAITLDPDRGQGYIAMGQLMVIQGEFDKAEYWYELALGTSNVNPWWYVYRANAASESGNLVKAINIYQDTINRYPDFSNAYYEIAQVYLQNHQNDEAINAIEHAIVRMEFPNQWYYVRAGMIYEAAGFTDKALAAYRQALLINSGNNQAVQAINRLAGK